MKFTKMHGIGNDFVMVNWFESAIDEQSVAELARRVCDRRFGVGSDGLIVVQPGQSEKFAMRMWNPDGSESEMCGNGIRCFANFLRDEKLTTDSRIPVETGAGRLVVTVQPDGRILVDMGRARLTRLDIGMSNPSDESFVNQPVEVHGATYWATAVSMGNPHLVIFHECVDDIDLAHIGPSLEKSPLFPNRTNVHFVQVISHKHIKMRTWERGAGITLACGTGACACAVASFLNGHTGRTTLVSLPGGDLDINYLDSGTVLMTGPTETVFEGTWN